MLPSDVYRTIARPAEGLYKEKGSKFLAFAYPVADEEEIKKILDQLKKDYYDAQHHCYAFMLGVHQPYYRANDGGEPNHSAGDPILGQIRSLGLKQVLVVVVRYFGGTKLGVSGLINAYKTAAADALSQAEILEKIIQEVVKIRFDYPQTSPVMKLVKDYELAVLAQNFGARCEMEVGIRQSQLEEVKTQLAQIPCEFLGAE